VKKFRFCFKTEDYEGKSAKDVIFIILDKSRGYYGIKFSSDSSEIKYGKVTCVNSGNEYDNYYFERTFYNWCFYHRHPIWDKKYKSIILKFYNYKVKVLLDV
jgi:hypothetical protein